MREVGSKYLFQCKANYHNCIRPANKESCNKDGYKRLIELANEFFKSGNLNEFAGFFQEYQYLVDLWTAHIIIDYGNPSKKLKEEAIEIIKLYSTTPLNEELAKEEKKWLHENNIS